MTPTPRLCSTCKFCFSQDYGYSNYTVEGTDLSCLKGLNQMDGEDRPWGPTDIISVESALRFAEKCDAYVEGEGPAFDVDGEMTAEAFKDDAELYALLKARDA